MIHVLVKYAHSFFGQLTILILWQCGRHPRIGNPGQNP